MDIISEAQILRKLLELQKEGIELLKSMSGPTFVSSTREQSERLERLGRMERDVLEMQRKLDEVTTLP